MKEVSLLDIKDSIKTIYIKENTTGKVYQARCNHIDGPTKMTVEINNSILNITDTFFSLEIGTDTQLFCDKGITLERVANVMCTYVINDMKLTVQNRRMHKRVSCYMDSYLKVANKNYMCTIVNISEGGALVKVVDDMDASGIMGRLNVPLDGKDTELEVMIIRTVKQVDLVNVHCKFSSLASMEQQKLFKLVYKLQVNERLMTRSS